MKKALVLVDFQNDFIDGSLGTKEAQAIIPNVIEKLSQYSKENRLATQDTHFEDYLTTQEGKNLPVTHCQMVLLVGKFVKKLKLALLKFLKNNFWFKNIGRIYSR